MIFKKIKEKWNFLVFKMQIWQTKHVLNRVDNVFSYPLLLDLTFNEHWYWQKYVEENFSVNKSTVYKSTLLAKTMLRKLNRPPMTREVYQRYDRFVKYVENKRFVDKMLEEFPDLKE